MIVLIVIVLILAALWLKSRRDAAIVAQQAETLGVSEEIQEARKKVRSPYLEALDHVVASGVTHAKAVKAETKSAMGQVAHERKKQQLKALLEDEELLNSIKKDAA